MQDESVQVVEQQQLLVGRFMGTKDGLLQKRGSEGFKAHGAGQQQR